MTKKAKRPASLYPSGLAYFLFHRLPGAIFKNLHYIATGAFFVYIIGISGGADIRYVTDGEILTRVLLGGIVWIALLAVCYIVRSLGEREEK